jgi:GMP synthase-like glutamine amidotransferase
VEDKPVLILQHQTPERPAYLATWLKLHGVPYVTVNASTGEFPKCIDNYSALAVMGGSMSANDPLPSNNAAQILILQAFYRDIPVIGHCLGGQLMAKALGAEITDSPQPEIGWAPIHWVDCPSTDSWFGRNPTGWVAHWHYQAFSLPHGAILLAGSDACPNQAFTIGKHLAMQFHIEVDPHKINSWVEDGDPDWLGALGKYTTVQNREQILSGVGIHMAYHQITANNVYKKWLESTGHFTPSLT